MADRIGSTIRKYIWIRDTLLSGVHLNCTEIGARLGISTKSAQRYIRLLREEGYRIEYVSKIRGFKMEDKPWVKRT